MQPTRRTRRPLERNDQLTFHASNDGASPVSAAAVPGVPILQLVDGIADLEYAIGSREAVKRIFMPWIVAHVIAAISMYFLLTLHIAGAIYYGLRWLP
jgi:hypothetical protein